MASDQKSMEESGGGIPRPYVPPPPTQGNMKPEEPMGGDTFSPPGIATSEIPPSSPIIPPMVPGGTPAKKPKKTLFIMLLTLVLVVGLAAVGYYFVFPYFFEQIPIVEQPVVTQPEPEIPPVTETPPVATTTETPPVSVPPSIIHVSFFKTAADTTETVTLATIDLQNYKAAFSFGTAEVAILNEAMLEDPLKNVLTFAQATSFLLPTTFTADVLGNFEPDFTFFTYTDDKGKWPGFIAKTKDGVSISGLKSNVSNLEQSGETSNLFITDPGTSGTWKGGETSGVTNRYLTFGLAGAGLNYGWSGNFLVVSA
jgi:hypothetical protein